MHCTRWCFPKNWPKNLRPMLDSWPRLRVFYRNLSASFEHVFLPRWLWVCVLSGLACFVPIWVGYHSLLRIKCVTAYYCLCCDADHRYMIEKLGGAADDESKIATLRASLQRKLLSTPVLRCRIREVFISFGLPVARLTKRRFISGINEFGQHVGVLCADLAVLCKTTVSFCLFHPYSTGSDHERYLMQKIVVITSHLLGQNVFSVLLSMCRFFSFLISIVRLKSQNKPSRMFWKQLNTGNPQTFLNFY